MFKKTIAAVLVSLALVAALHAQNAEYGTRTITTTATLIFSNPGQRGWKVLVRNTSAVNIFVGRSDATTTAASFRIDPGDAASFVLPAGDSIYGLVATGSQEIYYSASLY